MTAAEEQLARTIAKDIVVAVLQGINIGPSQNHDGKQMGAAVGEVYTEALKAVRSSFQSESSTR